MNVTFRRIGAFLLSMIFLFSVIGCGGPKKVDNQEMTLHLVYGDRSGKYTGEVDDSNLPNGKGKFETKNSKGEVWYYEGDFKNGHFEGQGKCVWPATNQIAEGTYVNDRLNGQGKIYNKVNGKEEVKREGNFVAGLLMKAEMVGLNTEVNYADWTYKVTSVKTQNSAGNKQASGQYLVLTMDAQNNGTQTRQPGAAGFYSLADIKIGRTFQMDSDASLKQRLASNNYNADWYLSEVNPGNKAVGFEIIFDVPKDIDLSTLVLIPSQSQGDATPIKLQ